jgi:hypothetical protein
MVTAWAKFTPDTPTRSHTPSAASTKLPREVTDSIGGEMTDINEVSSWYEQTADTVPLYMLVICTL